MITTNYIPAYPYGTDPFGIARIPRKIRQGVLIHQCKDCGGEFPHTLEFFYKAERLGNRLDSHCKSCSRKRRARYPQGHKSQLSRHKSKLRQRHQYWAGKPQAPRHFWSAIRAAIEFGVAESTLREWSRDGRIPSVPHGEYRRYDPVVIRALAEERGRAAEEVKPAPPVRYEPRTPIYDARKYRMAAMRGVVASKVPVTVIGRVKPPTKIAPAPRTGRKQHPRYRR